MAKGKLTRKNCLTSVKSRINPKHKSRKNSVYSRRAVKKNQPPISYKESHSIGRRQSTHVPTYNESGRLYFDLYVKYGPTDCFANKEDKVTKESNHSCGFDSDISDTTTVACNDASSHSPGKKKLDLKKKREQTSRRNRNVVQSPRSSVLYTRREASLNAEAKVNMLFESPKECRLKRKSSPVSLTPKVREDVSGPINENSDCASSRRRASRLRISDPPISYSPPKKRLAGLNATAIISAFMKSPKPTPSSDAKPRRCGKQSKASPSQLAGQDDSLVNVKRQSACIVSSNQSQVPNHSNPLTAVAMPMPPPAPAAPAPPQPTSLACELGSSQVHSTLAREPPKQVDRAVSPMPEMKCDSASSSACNVLVKKTPTKRVSPEKKQAPCLWVWEGTPNERPVFVKPDSPPVARMCYPSMRHEKDGMVVCPGDNVLLCSGPDRHSAPHVAKVTALFDNPDNGTKMMALLWYYRPDSLTPPRRSGVVECELFASRHCDVNPVDCIDDRAYVLSAAPYARFMALAKYKQEARTHRRSISAVPRIAAATPRDATATSTSTEVFAGNISEFPEDAIPSNVFLCRAWYDFRSRRVMRHLKSLNSNLDNGGNSNNGSFSNSSKTSHQQQQQQQLDTSSPVQPPAVNSSCTLLTLAPPLLSLPSPPVLRPEEEAAENEAEAAVAEAVEEISNGRTVLEKTADISINWSDHGEQIALSLGGAPLSPSPKKPDAAPVTSSPTSATTPTSAPGPVPTSTSQPPHMLLSSSSPS
ncbi:Bromo adjacenty domain-containing 1 protein [Echinococcus granulosus]|uniref:Bromo adjacenty domain-containing 1 protein n=1 Tax=Echinococcus granulosus TaxID=6210 RepID=W6UXS4_ECHGR|nr:Bromo adjacenty domain-containing 1 protein [Echinococcus granulosus]EUB63382.1 Bromo adjacenty domain-containing 1 protein [Echinococcus granulosus]